MGAYWRGEGLIKLFTMDHVGLLEGGGGDKKRVGLIRGNSILGKFIEKDL